MLNFVIAAESAFWKSQRILNLIKIFSQLAAIQFSGNTNLTSNKTKYKSSAENIYVYVFIEFLLTGIILQLTIWAPIRLITKSGLYQFICRLPCSATFKKRKHKMLKTTLMICKKYLCSIFADTYKKYPNEMLGP